MATVRSVTPMEPITWVFAAIAAVAVFVIAAVVVGREAHRLDAVAPRVVYRLDEAVDFVADRVPPATQARLTPAEVEQLLVFHLRWLHAKGLQPVDVDRPPPGHRHADRDRRGHAHRLPPRGVRARGRRAARRRRRRRGRRRPPRLPRRHRRRRPAGRRGRHHRPRPGLTPVGRRAGDRQRWA